jgi:phosphinothricin acetyltransferase
MNIRAAQIDDVGRINEIHNQAIKEKFKVAYTTPWTHDMMLDWLTGHDGKDYPVYVAETGAVVIGFVYISPYRPGRTALRQTAEISYFVDENYRRKGVGKKLIEFMESRCEALGIKTLCALLLDSNAASIQLLEQCGYTKWGHLPGIALFDNVEAGHFYYGKRIAP